jgi:hypothetical protein
MRSRLNEIGHFPGGFFKIFLMLIGCVYLLVAESLGNHEEISLNGTWEIVFDHHNEGKAGQWHLNRRFSKLSELRTINVPIAWESIETDYEGVAFYRKDFEVPAEWSGKIVRIRFGAVNYRAEVWLNDEVVGVHEGGFTPFDFRVDKILKPGEENFLILRVLGPIVLSDKVVDGIGPMETPQWRGGLTGGIWQPVQPGSHHNMHSTIQAPESPGGELIWPWFILEKDGCLFRN